MPIKSLSLGWPDHGPPPLLLALGIALGAAHIQAISSTIQRTGGPLRLFSEVEDGNWCSPQWSVPRLTRDMPA
jgi:hypothetical protein